jgi:hypothetical protein
MSLVDVSMSAAVIATGGIKMRNQINSITKSGRQAELQCLLGSASDLRGVFSIHAAVKGTETANRLKKPRIDDLEDGLR